MLKGSLQNGRILLEGFVRFGYGQVHAVGTNQPDPGIDFPYISSFERIQKFRHVLFCDGRARALLRVKMKLDLCGVATVI